MAYIEEKCIAGSVVTIRKYYTFRHNCKGEKREKRSHLTSEAIALIDYKLSELTKRVDKHNNVIERTFKLEELTALQEEKIKVANHRIEDLEKKG